ncbi:MAG: glycosyltransferase family 39 protein [Bacteroidia bacterium]
MSAKKQQIKWSWIGLWSTIIMLLLIRLWYISEKSTEDFKVTTWDSFGYYMYLPGLFIYGDLDRLSWVEEIDKTYELTGGKFYQAAVLPEGRRTGKYLTGVSIMQLPFFLMAHGYAILSHQFPADGFSYPYQLAIAWAPLIYTILSLFLFRLVLRRYFNESITAIVMLASLLATNAAQYISVEGGQSHGYIFPLYVLMLYLSMRWHEKPSARWAMIGGLVFGLAMISRPTEFIMLFIPILWNTHSRIAAKEKWALVREHRLHLLYAAVAAFLIVLPQLIYWKYSTGAWVYDVGSKWYFLNPWFRVLVGWTKGWFIYTPITIAFVAGLFFLRRFPFKNSVLAFCLLNIWIVISWSDWRYGGSYSARALVQSYPVMGLAIGALLTHIQADLWKKMTYGVLGFLLCINLFQIWQYNKNILHFNDMNRKYYQAIFLNPSPNSLDMSLLDTDEMPSSLARIQKTSCTDVLFRRRIEVPDSVLWIRVQSQISVSHSFWNGKIEACLIHPNGDSILKERAFRLAHPLAKDGALNEYDFFIKVPKQKGPMELILKLSGEQPFLENGWEAKGTVCFQKEK